MFLKKIIIHSTVQLTLILYTVIRYVVGNDNRYIRAIIRYRCIIAIYCAAALILYVSKSLPPELCMSFRRANDID